MARQDGIYAQGAYITRDDFDPVKTIKYFCGLYEINISDEIINEIATDNLSDANIDYLKNMLEIRKAVYTAQDICNAILNPMEMSDLFVETSKGYMIGNDMVVGKEYRDIHGYYNYSDEDKMGEYMDGNVIMLRFYVPMVWNIKGRNIPESKEHAISLLKEAGAKLLKDNINWDKRLGELTATVSCF